MEAACRKQDTWCCNVSNRLRNWCVSAACFSSNWKIRLLSTLLVSIIGCTVLADASFSFDASGFDSSIWWWMSKGCSGNHQWRVEFRLNVLIFEVTRNELQKFSVSNHARIVEVTIIICVWFICHIGSLQTTEIDSICSNWSETRRKPDDITVRHFKFNLDRLKPKGHVDCRFRHIAWICFFENCAWLLCL